ncbi:Helix-turn-helix [Thermosyntropha lipolytica DSM 11003]|uniref:Helix-turn-helix n=1 Tax=Thermosyntropha lipolytica DSM 11003 TaxID=1123382 RepID=A0A1M5JC94_9FIRM|nr:helix-turn-helix transcriptional regulator [Thermosyntropha lipolytica]SHG37870.1 Helix-turn-helix [Thermosyntropha lipolytica DSM 11003]
MSFKDIGRKIQMAREEKGLTQEQLAKALGCSQSALSNYEKGKRRLYLSHMEKLSEILEKPLEYFLESSPSNKDWSSSSANNAELIDKITFLLKDLDTEDLKEISSYIEYLKWRKKERR